MTRGTKAIVVIGSVFLLGACSTWNSMFNTSSSQGASSSAMATEPDVVSIKLAQAADKASKALDNLANIDQQRFPATKPLPDDYATASPNLMQPVSLRWSGPMEQVTRTLAERAGLRFRVKGRQPVIPIVVNVDAYQQPILHVLRDIGLQAGTRADLEIDQNEGVAEVRYAAADQSR